MEHCITVGCDVHTKNTLVKAAAGRDEPLMRSFRSNRRGRAKMLAWLGEWSASLGGARVVVVYETSLTGFVLYDAVVAAGFECYVLATSKLARSWKNRVHKTDERDAQMLFELARAHVLAGNPLPMVVVPDPEMRDHREVTRTRTDLADKVTRVKNQVQGLLKRYGLERPATTGKSWTKAFHAWLSPPDLGAKPPRASRLSAQRCRKVSCCAELPAREQGRGGSLESDEPHVLVTSSKGDLLRPGTWSQVLIDRRDIQGDATGRRPGAHRPRLSVVRPPRVQVT